MKKSVESTSKRQFIWVNRHSNLQLKQKAVFSIYRITRVCCCLNWIPRGPDAQQMQEALSGLWVAFTQGAHLGWWPYFLFSALERDRHERLTDDRAHCHTLPWVDRPPGWEEGNLSSVRLVGDGGQSEVSACLGKDSSPTPQAPQVFSAPPCEWGWNMISIYKEPEIKKKMHTWARKLG